MPRFELRRKESLRLFPPGILSYEKYMRGIVELCDWRCLFAKNSLEKRMKNTYKIGKTLQAEPEDWYVECRGVVVRGL